jgi:hypothetical protein
MSEQIVDLAPVFEAIRDRIPADATHLLLLIPSRQCATLWTLPNGMYAAECAEKMSVEGFNPNKRESRLFLSHQHAKDYVRSLAGTDSVIFEHDIEAGFAISVLNNEPLILPGGDTSLAVNGSHRVDGKTPTLRKLN